VRRRLVTIATATSLLLCAATVAINVWSYRAAAMWEYGHVVSKSEVDQFGFVISRGSLVLARGTLNVRPDDESTDALLRSKSGTIRRVFDPPPQMSPEVEFAGFGVTHNRVGGPDVLALRNEYFVPLWAVSSLFALLPLSWVRRRASKK